MQERLQSGDLSKPPQDEPPGGLGETEAKKEQRVPQYEIGSNMPSGEANTINRATQLEKP